MRKIGCLGILTMLSACSNSEPTAPTCSEQCLESQQCINGTCKILCYDNDVCGAEMACQNGYCEPYAQACRGNQECTQGWFCTDSGVCTRMLPVGSACGDDPTHCISGYCADRVCCATPCNGVCEGCDFSGSLGECLPVAGMTDDTCNATTTAGSCADGSCICDQSSQCRSTAGANCTTNDQCDSGSCADGVCCQTECASACVSCNPLHTGGLRGVCRPVYQDQDPRALCPGLLACTGTGTCQTTWTGIKQLGSEASEWLLDAVTDAQGFLYVVGGTKGSLQGTNAGDEDAFFAKYDFAGVRRFLDQFGGAQADQADKVALDSSGAVYVCGRTTSAGFDSQATYGGYDVFVRKYGADGRRQWTKIIGSDKDDLCEGLAVDHGGNVYASGSTKGALQNCTPSGTTVNCTAIGATDAFLAKLDTNGARVWIKQFGTTAEDNATEVITDSSGIYVTGATAGAMWGTNAGSADVFLAKYDGEGAQLWVRQKGSASADASDGLALDSSGNVYLVGYADATLDDQPHNGGHDVLFIKYNAEGTRLWTRLYSEGSDVVDQAFDVTVSGSSVYLTGSFTGKGVVLLQYSTAGDFQWAKAAEATVVEGTTQGNALVIDGEGNVCIGGTTTGSLGGSNAGETDVYVLKYSAEGDLR